MTEDGQVDGAALTEPADAADQEEQMRAPLLLHSLAELRDVIIPCLDIAGARTVVEVGAEDGTFTKELLAWAEPNDGMVYSIEPKPPPILVEMCRASRAGQLVEEKSPAALEKIDGADAYVIDGDHNYYTVRGELEVIERKGAERGHLAIVFLQDIGWPWGRRDSYYSPESLPAEAVHPYSYDKGVTLGTPGLVDSGFRGEGEYAIAEREGGPANGVLTAVEDFLEGRSHLTLAQVPCIFGLGVLYATSAPYAESLASFLHFYDDNPLLSRTEHNRLSLYLKVLALQDHAVDLGRHLEETQLQLRDAASENRALWNHTHKLEARVAALEQEIENLLHSRALVVAEKLSTPTRLRGRGPGVSRQRLRAVLDK